MVAESADACEGPIDALLCSCSTKVGISVLFPELS